MFTTQKNFLEVIYKRSCSALINVVMKYLNFCSSGSKLESITYKFTNFTYTVIFQRISLSVKQYYWKMHPDGCFWWQLYFGNFPEWLLLKDSCKDIFTVLQIRASQRSITANLWPLTAHIYHVMIIVAGDSSKKSYYYYYYF